MNTRLLLVFGTIGVVAVLAVGGANSPVGGPNITMSSVVYGMKILAQNVQGIIVPNSVSCLKLFYTI